MKLFIGIPARDGRITAATAVSLLAEQELFGEPVGVGVIPGCSVLHVARDQVVRDFLASGAEKLVFVDEDISWNPGDLKRLASHPVDLVGGCYRFKKDEEGYPVQFLPTARNCGATRKPGCLKS